MNHVAPSSLPLELVQVEAHPHAAQVFLPVDVDRYVVTVMPGGDTPDPAGALSVILPGTVGIAYRPGAWHAGMTVLAAPATSPSSCGVARPTTTVSQQFGL